MPGTIGIRCRKAKSRKSSIGNGVHGLASPYCDDLEMRARGRIKIEEPKGLAVVDARRVCASGVHIGVQ
ncbi:MAG: hypothetical protein ABI231_07560, partial [Candidatus Tumulicola sp.]